MNSDVACMLCGRPGTDSPGGLVEEDDEGDWWSYCSDCDCWTSHPPQEQEHADG